MKNKSAKRKPPEPWQVEDAARLKALYESRTKLRQDDFGEQFRIGTQGAVSQFLNGTTALNLTMALRFAKGLGVDVSAFSPTLSAEIEHLTKGHGPVLAAVADLLQEPDRIEAIEYLRFKLSKAPVTEMLRAHYDTLLAEIKRDPLQFDEPAKPTKPKVKRSRRR